MHYLIDGYNLFFSLTEENPTRNTRLELIETLEKLTYHAHINASIVFDSRDDVASNYASVIDHESLEVIYSARGQSADEYIIEFVSALKEPKRVCIVTNDKAIIMQVKQYGAHNKSLAAFLSQLKPKKPSNHTYKQTPSLTNEENKALLQTFEKRYKNQSY